MGVQIQVK